MNVPATLLALILFEGMAPAHAAIPLEAYGVLPSVENIVLSPNGELAAFVRTAGDERIVAIIKVPGGEMVTGTRTGIYKIRDLEWADDRHLLIVTSTTTSVPGLMGPRSEYYQLALFDLETKKAQMLPKAMARVSMMNVIAGEPMVRTIQGRTVIFVTGIYLSNNMTSPALFRYDVESGEQTLVEGGTPFTQQWFVDEAGEIVARVDYVEAKRAGQVLIRRDKHYYVAWSNVSPIAVPRILGFGENADTLIVVSMVENNPVLRALPLSKDATNDSAAKLVAFEAPIRDPLTRYMIGGSNVEDSASYEFFDSRLQRRWATVLRTFPDERVRLESMSKNLDRVVVRVDGTKTGFSFMFVDLTQATSRPFGKVYEKVDVRHETRPLKYAAADGMEIPAYLTLPTGRTAKALPLIVLPHGGPAVRDSADFDWWAQALASQGYAVLQPNYRGSAVGWEFMSAGFGEWGRKMQTDLSDGVRHLTKEGIVDPARVCIAGASYGGYAALAGVTIDPGVYRCAVSVAGLSDLSRFLSWVKSRTRYGEKTAQRYWDQFMGAEGPKDPVLARISPAANVDAMTAPVLLIHGKDDTVVPFEQSNLMVSAMKRAKKNVELVTLKREDHWLSRGETRLQMLQSSVAFLRQHNPAD